MPTILIATDNAEDAKMVERQLAKEYENICTSTNDILAPAFNALEKAERC